MRKGFTLIELLTVLTLMGVMMAISVPFLRVSPKQKAESAALQLARDLDLARTRGLAAKRAVRMKFDESAGGYVGFMDHDDNDVFDETLAESQALQAFGVRVLAGDVKFGVGSAGPIPGETGSGAVTFTNGRVEFDSQGITSPFGTRGTVYLVHRDHPEAVAAVSVTGSASFKVWHYRQGAWQ
jgi:prepilin-type N-terminal cleavage/methylation domain-containing protein